MPAKRNPSPVFLLDMAADVLAVIAAYFAAFYIRFRSPLGPLVQSFSDRIESSALMPVHSDFAGFYLSPVNAIRIILLLSVILVILNAFFGLYAGRRFLRSDYTAFKLLETDFFALLLFVSYLYLSRNQFHPRSTFLLLILLHFFFAFLLRKLAARLMTRLRRATGIDRHPVLLTGETTLLDPIEQYLLDREPHGYYPAGRFLPEAGADDAEAAARLVREAEARGADTILCADSRLPLSALMTLLDKADEKNLTVKLGSPRLDLLLHQARIESDIFRGEPLIHFSPTSDFAAIQRLRRITSVLFSLAFLLVFWPVLLGVALLIKLTSRGPVLFIQERVGMDGHPFRMLKFRTMDPGRGGGTPAGGEDEAAFKIKNDPRVTPAGRFLRKFSLDELPQFWNVLKGDMNEVGPRPLPLGDYRHFNQPWHRSRHKGLPGITGLWQVSGRSDLTFEQMCVLDVYYLHNASLSLDLSLLFRTTITILFAEGAY